MRHNFIFWSSINLYLCWFSCEAVRDQGLFLFFHACGILHRLFINEWMGQSINQQKLACPCFPVSRWDEAIWLCSSSPDALMFSTDMAWKRGLSFTLDAHMYVDYSHGFLLMPLRQSKADIILTNIKHCFVMVIFELSELQFAKSWYQVHRCLFSRFLETSFFWKTHYLPISPLLCADLEASS